MKGSFGVASSVAMHERAEKRTRDGIAGRIVAFGCVCTCAAGAAGPFTFDLTADGDGARAHEIFCTRDATPSLSSPGTCVHDDDNPPSARET
jgi:hypothetical protein